MNKKALVRLGILALGVLILVLLLKDGCGDPKPSEPDPLGTIITTKVEDTSKAEVTDVFLLMDPSASMKGYMDFAEFPAANKGIVDITVKPLSNLANDFNANLMVKYGPTGRFAKTTAKEVSSMMTTGKAFNGAVTMLDAMIADAVKQASDTSVSIFVSDMVMSYGRSKLIQSRDKWLNKHNLPDLGTSVFNALKGAQDIHVLLLQYYSDFNGKYYYNCTENLENGNQYRAELMKDRPYYIMVFGKENVLKSLLDNGVFVKHENIYASFDLNDNDMTEGKFYVKLGQSSSWIPETETSTIWTKTDLGTEKEEFDVYFDKFSIPLFLNPKYEIGDYRLSKVIQDIEDVTDLSNPHRLCFRITLKPFNQLPANGKVEFTLVSENTWAAEASVANDDDVNIGSIGDLEKKTWGLGTILKNIDAAYLGNKTRAPQTVARISFNLEKRDN